METQQTLFKGEFMEEQLRNYFLSLGYYVVRSVKYRYENNDITDVDLYLYKRTSSLTRERINVDIKNKKSPQAFERILWVNGVRQLLNFDACIVATTDRRPVIHSFAQLHNTTVLDGAFLAKMRSDASVDRYSEEDFCAGLANVKSYKTFGNLVWRYIYETSKSRLLSEQDFSGFNETLLIINYCIEKILTDPQKRVLATRLMYVIISHLLIIIDYILKDIAFLEQPEREKKLSDGFKFGNLGKEGVDKIIGMAVQISGNKSASSIMKALENAPTDILRDFFAKNEVAKNVFHWAREFESLAFKKDFVSPEQAEPLLKVVISVLLDYNKVDRKRFFETSSTISIEKKA